MAGRELQCELPRPAPSRFSFFFLCPISSRVGLFFSTLQRRPHIKRPIRRQRRVMLKSGRQTPNGRKKKIPGRTLAFLSLRFKSCATLFDVSSALVQSTRLSPIYGAICWISWPLHAIHPCWPIWKIFKLLKGLARYQRLSVTL